MLAARSAGSFCPNQLSQALRKSKPSQCCTIDTTYCLLVVIVFLFAQWTVAIFLPGFYFASQIRVTYWVVREAREETFQYMKWTTIYMSTQSKCLLICTGVVLPRPKLSWHLQRVILTQCFDFVQRTGWKELWSSRKLFLLDTLYIILLY